MAANATDTGGLGLLQQLMQSGFPPQLLMQLLQHPQAQQALLQPQDTSPQSNGGESGASAPAFTGATPGNEGGTVGTGALSASQAAASFMSGMSNGGLAGRAAEAAGLPSVVGSIGARAALGLMGLFSGAPTTPFSLANTLFGGLVNLATDAKNSEGPRGDTKGIPLSDALRDLTLETPDARGFPNDPTTLGLAPTPDPTTNDPSGLSGLGMSGEVGNGGPVGVDGGVSGGGAGDSGDF